MLQVKLKQKEGKTLKFTYTDADGNPVNVSSAVFSFRVKKDETLVIEKLDVSFDKSQAALGIVKLTLTETDLNLAVWVYWAQVKAYISAGNVDVSDDIKFLIERSLFA
jgi:hypothetical protein